MSMTEATRMDIQEWRQRMEAMAHCDDPKIYHQERAELLGIAKTNNWLQRAPECFFWNSRIYSLKTRILKGETIVSLKTGKALLSLADVEARMCRGSEDLTEAVRLMAINEQRLATTHLKRAVITALFELLYEFRAELDHEMQGVSYREFKGAA